MLEHRIIEHFMEVKRIYFPRWDRGDQWRAEFGGKDLCRHNTGYCDSKAKRVYLDEDVTRMIDAGVTAFLIHEICHDVGAAGHGISWAKRMEQAACHAISIGAIHVAFIVRSDIYSYCNLDVYERAVGDSEPPPRPAEFG